MTEGTQKVKHWADITAERIIQQKGDRPLYVLASGITPSGVVHFGNFRESITVDFVARALRDLGKEVRFIFSWDDYDTFRKVPKNMPNIEELEKFLFCPIVDTPDPYGKEESYARHHEVNFEEQLKKVGINAFPIYQAKQYRKGTYRQGILKALQSRDLIASILNAHRSEPLEDHWWPISIYCEKCNRDKMSLISYDGHKTLHYHCELCSFQGSLDLETSSRIKLPWRVDWPMRWSHEQVDFEPGGKDHSSQGGSYTTAKEIVKKVYNYDPPVYLQYDFVSIKGAGGKMSSSSGEVITVNDVLDVYEPEMVRWIFASYKTNVDFSISFDLDVIKTYEDFDRQERLAYGHEEGNEKKVLMAKRVYELSSLDGKIPDKMPFQPAFRHLTNVLQIHGHNIEEAKKVYDKEIKNDRDERRFYQRAQCASFWLNHYAPEDFKFELNQNPVDLMMSESQGEFVRQLHQCLSDHWDQFIDNDKALHEKLYEILHATSTGPEEIFPMLYQKLISKEKGPKLAGFLLTIGKDRATHLLAPRQK